MENKGCRQVGINILLFATVNLSIYYTYKYAYFHSTLYLYIYIFGIVFQRVFSTTLSPSHCKYIYIYIYVHIIPSNPC